MTTELLPWARHLAAAMAELRGAGIDDPSRDARVLLAHAAGVGPERVTLILHDPAPAVQADHFAALIARRASRVPVSHLTGKRQFWGRTFQVGPEVLDPRPETEILVAAALEQAAPRVLDLGTGSGCILLSLLADCPEMTGVGVDLSSGALQIAAANAATLGVSDRVDFVQGDWFTPVKGVFDLIVSNPPYIALTEMAGLAPEVIDHEPRLALTDEGDGLTAYRAIAAGAPLHLTPGGRLLVEIGPTQGSAVAALFAQAGLVGIELRSDLDGRDRVVGARAP